MYFLDQSIKNMFYLLLKREALKSTHTTMDDLAALTTQLTAALNVRLQYRIGFPSSSWSCQCPRGCGTVVKRYTHNRLMMLSGLSKHQPDLQQPVYFCQQLFNRVHRGDFVSADVSVMSPRTLLFFLL